MDCSLTGNITPDGSAAFYNVIFNLADKVKARAFPMPLPVFATLREERDLLRQQPMIKITLELAANANVAFLGSGELNDDAPLHEDGFISAAELRALQQSGGVGKFVGWSYDCEGRIIESMSNGCVASRARQVACHRHRQGRKKLPGIAGAIKRRIINGLITDELTAKTLLAE